MKQALILEDVQETRAWLCDIARQAFPDIALTEVATVATANLALDRQVPDLALIDLGLPDGSGLEVLRKLKSVSPQSIAVVTTIMGDDVSVVSALSAGADGYLQKDQTLEQMVAQLRQISHGIPALSPAIARRIMGHFSRTGPAVNDEGKLTERESDVLALISRGLRNAEVAAELGLAESTVAGYIKTIYRKLGISSRAEAAWHATRMGLSQPRGT
ncbi:response regulator transcription factor [Maritimibacter sp. UBA3975]|uniref:response regulator transcription factor n=1 Tax=Maritimibacter sp. UBA3975 TaxID=1946833 RepID=UPI000C090CE3|nr:response regulator transcription factor [Maritimibacter sp. UBA3975]MAM62063.1 DNA-binding response regulator [Maritimibacter sp.]|tara:strand:- start:5173 stop:5820 length:648 start_codon:yes stop_codon:yes gene_type:complete